MRVNFYEARAHRHGCEYALSGNIQNGTDHSRLRNCKKNIPLYFPEEGAPRFEPGPSRSAVECSTTELYTPRQRTFALRSVGADAKMPFLEIYRMGQIILRNFYDARSHRHGCTRIPS
ncbi:hypothetical protein TNCV_673561 [Trichonephila clavipes]|uniref:Uncharacterized protein n=1 Tax=Trichonephila clavipes TaxID=2585209 RepID=A0A8X6WEA9_TRICX|nr:hypothetical protein TNCV_673561 [Trichonephila clavipes]